MDLWNRASRFAVEHVALTVSFLVAVLVVLRALYFTSFDVPVALMVLALTNQATLLLSTLALVLIAAVSILWIADPGGAVARSHDADAPLKIVFWTTLTVTALIPLIFGAFVSPAFMAATFLVIFVWIGVKIRRVKRGTRPPSVKTRNRLVWFGGLTCGALLAYLLSQPWMPSERIEVSKMTEPVVGFLIGEQAGQMLVLDRHRTPVWIKTSSVEKREICDMSTVSAELRWAVTPIYRLSVDTTLPSCFES